METQRQQGAHYWPAIHGTMGWHTLSYRNIYRNSWFPAQENQLFDTTLM